MINSTNLQGHGKYNGISAVLDVTLFPLSFTSPVPVAFNILSGADAMNLCPLGHSYSTPTNILTTNSLPPLDFRLRIELTFWKLLPLGQYP